jgi:hypothetical protein
VRPSDSPKAFFWLLGFELIKPHMRVDIDEAGGQEGPQTLPVEFLVYRFDFK